MFLKASYKISEIEKAHYEESLFSIFQRFFASVGEILILGGGLDTRIPFFEVQRFS